MAAGTAILGYDMFANQTWRVSGKPRKLRGMAVTGSTAPGDASVDLYVDQYHVGKFYNTSLLFPDLSSDLIPLKGNMVPPGSTISAIVTDAAVGNPLNITLV